MFKISFGDTKDTTNIPSLVYQNKKSYSKNYFFHQEYIMTTRVYYDNRCYNTGTEYIMITISDLVNESEKSD